MIDEFGLDGLKVLESVLATSKYGSLNQAVASLSVFSHPNTCRQIVENVFPTIRNQTLRRTYQPGFMYDDNKSPTDAFLWANKLKRADYSDVQFNHIYPDSTNVRLYTNLRNIVITPAFLAKLTDRHAMPLLQYRAFELYGFAPNGVPQKPDGYDSLVWGKTLEPVINVEWEMRKAMMTKRKDSTVCCARTVGWCFSSFVPDESL